jgi:hypothetical protein
MHSSFCCGCLLHSIERFNCRSRLESNDVMHCIVLFILSAQNNEPVISPMCLRSRIMKSTLLFVDHSMFCGRHSITGVTLPDQFGWFAPFTVNQSLDQLMMQSTNLHSLARHCIIITASLHCCLRTPPSANPFVFAH